MTTKSEELNAPCLICENLRIGWGATPLLPEINFSVSSGSVWVLVGRNGSGKSTLLQTLLGVLKPLAGQCSLDSGSSLAHVPQRGNYDLCVPARSWDMVEAGVDRGWDFWRWGGRSERVRHALDAVGAADLARQPFSHLSEGQKQRVLMARAMASHPDVMLLDEPTSAMDPMAEKAIFQVIDDLRTDRSLAVIIASHSLTVVPAIATHVVFLDRDDQVVIAGDRAAVLADPRFQARYGTVFSEEES